MICSVHKAMLAVKADTLPQMGTSWLLKETLCPQDTLKEVVEWKLGWRACLFAAPHTILDTPHSRPRLLQSIVIAGWHCSQLPPE